jgi:hypothetical protein
MLATLRRLGAVTAIAATASLGTAAAAQAEMTISLGQPELTSKVLVTLPVTLTCSPFDAGLVLFQSQLTVSVEQAAGQRIARGFGNVFNAVPACDGTPHTTDVRLLADPLGPPFHGGHAVFSASAAATAGTPCPFAPGCFTTPFATQSTNVVSALRMH